MNIFVTLEKQKSKTKKKKLLYLSTFLIFRSSRWIEDCLQYEIDPIIKLEESMRNGIVLAKLSEWFSPGIARKIFQVQHIFFSQIWVI